MIERPPPPPDAGISLLGVYGLANPTIVWLLNKRPDLLAETPSEFAVNVGGNDPPDCSYHYRPEPVWEGPGAEDDVAERLANADDIDEAVAAELRKMGLNAVAGVVFAVEFIPPCGQRMTFRYVHGRPAWICLKHAGADETYPYHYQFIPRPRPKLTQEPTFDLWAEIGRALEGKSRDLVFDEGKWRLV